MAATNTLKFHLLKTTIHPNKNKMKKKTPIRYMGSKASILDWLYSHYPEHNAYVEPFGGSGVVLLNKPRVKYEVYNDINSDVVNIYRILRDPIEAKKLAAMIAATPYAREEYDLSNNGDTCEPLEAARRFIASSRMRIHPSNPCGFRWGIGKGQVYAQEWARLPEAIIMVTERYMGVIIEHESWEKIIPRYDSPGVFIYCDPPYPMATRTKSGRYKDEMGDEQHLALCEALNSLKHAKWAVSSYDNPLYNTHLNFRAKHAHETQALFGGKRVEVLYTSYDSNLLL